MKTKNDKLECGLYFVKFLFLSNINFLSYSIKLLTFCNVDIINKNVIFINI